MNALKNFSEPQLKALASKIIGDKHLIDQELYLTQAKAPWMASNLSGKKTPINQDIRGYNATRIKPNIKTKAPGMIGPIFTLYALDQLILVDLVWWTLYNADSTLWRIKSKELETIPVPSSIEPTLTYDVEELTRELEYVNVSERIKDFMESGFYTLWDKKEGEYLFEGPFSEAKAHYLELKQNEENEELFKTESRHANINQEYRVK